MCVFRIKHPQYLLFPCRFIRAYEDFSNSQIKQSLNRSLDRMPSVSEFIAARRATIGAALVEGKFSMIIRDHGIMIRLSYGRVFFGLGYTRLCV